MGMLAWVMMGLALWHFTIWLPDRFWGGIVGAFVGALIGAIVFGLIVNGGAIPGRHATDLVTALDAIPGALLGMAAVYFEGIRASASAAPARRLPRREAVPHFTRPVSSPDHARSAPAARFRRTSRLGSHAMAEPRLEVPACDMNAALALERELGVSDALAQVLVRRGHGDAGRGARVPRRRPTSIRADAFDGIDTAVDLVLGHVRAGTRITVHGDYDVDGVCSTAVLVRCLRRLGAEVDWYLPSRLDDGYGLSLATVERLAARGTRLLVTVDCAITAVEEVAAARAAGLDVLVTDHHRPRADGALPDAPIVHPTISAYPCEDLCATGVAFKLAQALEAAAGADPRRGRGGRRPRPRRAGHRGGLRAAAWARTAGSCARACARSPGPRSPGCARSCASPRPTRAASTPGRSASAWRRGSTPPGACTAPTPASSWC